MTQRNTSFGRRRKAINVLAAMLAAVVACGGVVWVAQGLDRFLEGEPYPAAMAQRLDGHTQYVHLDREYQRTHTSRYQQNFGLTA
ncbi:hypothetical protein [Streptomyces sp. NPDC097610]|uniref:hypothetical protein n=1 Tax=Streptomyces sp. NPDC097610 TaxID=3157227 RepID=UPI003331367D